MKRFAVDLTLIQMHIHLWVGNGNPGISKAFDDLFVGPGQTLELILDVLEGQKQFVVQAAVR
jgi:hypothetical protein